MGLKISAVACDRCGREFSPPEGGLPCSRAEDPKFLLRLEGKTAVRFDDLCDFCDKEVSVLLAEIADPKKTREALKKAEEDLKKVEEDLSQRKEEPKSAPASEPKESKDTKEPEPAKEPEGQKEAKDKKDKKDKKGTKEAKDGYGF